MTDPFDTLYADMAKIFGPQPVVLPPINPVTPPAGSSDGSLPAAFLYTGDEE